MSARRSIPKSPILPDTERLERSILGGIFDDPSLYHLAASGGLCAAQFSLSAHRQIFECMIGVAEYGDPVELTEVVRELERRGQLDAVGGAAYVAGLSDGIVADQSSMQKDIECLLDRQALRDFCRTAEELIGQASRPEAKVGELVSEAKVRLAKFEASMNNRRSWRKKAPVLDGGLLMTRLGDFIDRYVVLETAQRDVVSLWLVHTHTFEAADATAYQAVVSAEKRSGKTRLLEVASHLVAKPWFTARVSAAVLARKIDAESPSLLLDESDAAFKGDKEYAEVLRGILNSGHRRGGVTSLCVGKGAEITYKDFHTFCPKMIAGIGRLPDTISDRSITIQLKRRAPGERGVERFRFRTVESQAKPLREAVAAWARANLERLRSVRPELPEVLNDRQQDGAEPLLAIADLIGGAWPERARSAVIAIAGGASEDESLKVQLLADIWAIFQETDADRLSSEDLKNRLLQIETSPWTEVNRGKDLTPTTLARLLKPFKIYPKTMRIGTGTPKGYERSFFADAWDRYLSKASTLILRTSEPQHPQPGAVHGGETRFSTPQQTTLVADSENLDSPMLIGLVAAVAAKDPDTTPREGRGKRRVEEL